MNKLSTDKLLAQATCAVLIGNEIVGTAWLASHEGHLLTAGHVLGTEEPLTQVQVQFRGDVPRLAHKIEWLYHDNGWDFAVLKLNESLPRIPLPIALVQEFHGKFRLRGYGESLEKTQRGGIGEFVCTVSIENSAYNFLFQLNALELRDEGFSGGAVYSEVLGAVVAIQTEKGHSDLGSMSNAVFAMPLYRVAGLWEPLRALAIPPRGEDDTIVSPPITEVDPSTFVWSTSEPTITPDSQTIAFTGASTQFFLEETIIINRAPEPATVVPRPPRPTPPPTTLSQKVLSVLESCFELHRQSILAKCPENERLSAERRLDDLKYAFFTEPPELDKVKSGLEFFNAHPAALVRVQKLLREWVLERLVRRGGKEMQREYEGLVFGGN